MGSAKSPTHWGDIAITGDGEGRAAVALDDARVEVLGLLLGETVEPEVIEDEEVGG